MEMERIQVRGAEAVLIREPGNALATTHLRVATGSRNDPTGRRGLAHVVEHMMFSGTATSGRRDHARTIEQAGGFLNAKTSADSTHYVHVVAADLLCTVLELEAARFGGTVFGPEGLEADKAIVLQERFQRVSAPAFGDATERLLGEIYPGGSCYSHLPVGVAPDVEQVTVEDCRDFFAAHYVAPTVKVVVLGGFDMDAAVEGVTRLFDVLHDGPAPAPAVAVGLPGETVRREIVGKTGSRVFLGIPLPPAGTDAFDLAEFASVLLGFGIAGPLARMLVDDRGVLNAVKVHAVPRQWGGSMGVVELAPSTGVSPERAIDEFDEAMAVLAGGGGVQQHDLARAQALYASSWSSADDSQIRRAESLTLSLQLHGNIDVYLTQLKRIKTLRLSEAEHAVRMWHRPEARAEAVYRA